MEICNKSDCCGELIFKYKGQNYKVSDNPCKEGELGLGSYNYCYKVRCTDRLNYFLDGRDFTFLNMEIERQLREGDLIKM